MFILLAGIPLLAVVAALLMRQSVLRASILGVLLAAVIGSVWFTLTPNTAAEAVSQWWPLIVEVLLIVAGGIAFAEIGRRTGAQQELSLWLTRSLGVGVAPVLAIVHGVTPLAESLTGFGIGAALAVPLLAALGLDGRRAATIGLLGLCTVPWGSLGPGTLIAAELGGVGFNELGVASALVSLPVFVGVGIVAAALVAKSGRRLRACLAAAGSGLVLWVGVLTANVLFGTATAGALGALFTLLVHLLVSRVRGAHIRWNAEVNRAAVAYFVLLGGALAATFVVRIAGLGETPWRYIASPPLWLLIAAIVATRSRWAVLREARSKILTTWLYVGPATALFIVLGVVMSISGMSTELAAALAGMGGAYLFAVPFIGAAGGFITGSNSGANAMFTGPQSLTITTINADLLPAMAVHNVSASLLIMAAPARVELAVRLCPDPPSPGPVQRTLLAVDLTIVTVLGIILLIVASL